MKGLFQNKHFRKNLQKWLIMYLGVIALLTTVITYSKYITAITSTDSARVAKFKLNISEINCDDLITSDCNIPYNIRPTSNIEYNFKVDMSQIEVKTKITLKLKPESNFNITNIYEDQTILDNNLITSNEYTYEYTPGISPSTKVFKIILNYTGTDSLNSNRDYKVINIGYKIEQIK